jgi:hypothetical protein
MFDSVYGEPMPRQPTEQQRRRDQQDTRTLVDASWALRRLADQRRYRGMQPYVAYAARGVLDSASLNIEDVDKVTRSSLLRLAAAITQDANEEAAKSESART